MSRMLNFEDIKAVEIIKPNRSYNGDHNPTELCVQIVHARRGLIWKRVHHGEFGYYIKFKRPYYANVDAANLFNQVIRTQQPYSV